MRASISTCGCGTSSVAMSASARSMRPGRSVMMTVFVRSSTWTWPRDERIVSLMSVASSFAVA
jgi:hypothetical protein